MSVGYLPFRNSHGALAGFAFEVFRDQLIIPHEREHLLHVLAAIAPLTAIALEDHLQPNDIGIQNLPIDADIHVDRVP